VTVIRNAGLTAASVPIWLGWADRDYVSSRTLLLGGFLVQGSGLANTAVEKYLKAIFAVKNLKIPRTHDVVSLNSLLMQDGVSLALKPDFLKLLVRAYKLRYPDDLKPGFNVSLAKAKVLTELDTTVFEIRKGFDIRRDGQKVTTALDSLIRSGDSGLISLNCAFGTAARAEIFDKPTTCYDMRVLGDSQIIEAYYEAGPIPDDREFLAETLTQSNS
jgi:HEPN domain-containing protein